MKILIGYDGSKEADAMLKDLVNAGLSPKAEAFILQIVSPWVHYTQEAGDGMAAWPTPAAAKQYQLILDDQLKAARASKGKAELVLRGLFPAWKVRSAAVLDNPASGILSKADSWKPDLIAVGAHGRTAIGRFLMGSVSQRVVHHAHTDVRIVRKTRPGRRPQRILVGFDGSRGSEQALQAVAARTWPKGTEVRILRVVDRRELESPLFDGSAVDISRYLKDHSSEGFSKTGEAWAVKLRRRGVKTTSKVASGDPRKVLLDEAGKWKATCLFLGSRGLTGMERFFLGSVSSALAAHSPCTVEIIRQ